MLEEWIEAKAKLDYFKKLENKLRKKLVFEHFPNANEGTQDKEVGSYALKAGIKLNRTIDLGELDTLEHLFSEGEQDCIVRKPSLSMTAYKKLEDHERTTLDMCITTKPGLPSLTVTLMDEFE